MTPNEILRDFRTKYQHTYVWLKAPENGKQTLCFIDAVVENRDRQAVIQLSSLEYGKLVLNFASNHEMRFRFPNSGSFQHGKDSLVILRRPPHRQYQRGLCAANHALSCCTEVFTSDTHLGVQFSLDTINSAFQQVKYRGAEAMAMLKTGLYRSVALGGRFSLTQPLDKVDMPMLFLNTVCLGRVKDDLSFVPLKGAETMVDEAQRVLLDI